MSTHVLGQGSWIRETFWTPSRELLNCHLQTAIALAPNCNNASAASTTCVPYDDDYMEWLQAALESESLEYKQYALIAFLHSNAAMQDWVQKRESPRVYEDFMRVLGANIQNYVSGLKWDGSHFSKSAQIRSRSPLYFVAIARTLACKL
jgi:lysophospholipase L1-like esterase